MRRQVCWTSMVIASRSFALVALAVSALALACGSSSTNGVPNAGQDSGTVDDTAADGSTLYLLYLPAGITTTGANFTSFHQSYPDKTTTKGDGFAIVGRETPLPGETQLDQLTKVASHEIIEAATNPTGSGFRLAKA